VELLACDPHPGCDAVQISADLARVADRLPAVADIAGRMSVYCLEDTSSMCLRDVDACTIGVGLQARMAVRLDVPVGNAVAHEAVHWHLWDVDPCASHSPSCGWDPDLVEALQ
jgi:hypothetical protein